nr:hypothetical protein [Tanacetum cinerariifolium]
MDEVKEHVDKKKRGVVFEELPVKRLRVNAAAASKIVPSTGGKSSAALKRLELQSGQQGVGSSSVPPPVEEFVSSSITLPPSLMLMRHLVLLRTGVFRPIELLWGSLCLLAMGLMMRLLLLRLRILLRLLQEGLLKLLLLTTSMFRNEVLLMVLGLIIPLFAQRDAEITALKTRLERAEHEAVEVVSIRGHVYKMEAMVVVKSQEVETLGKQNAELLSKEVVGEAKLREDFKSFQDVEARHFEQKSAELDSRIADVRHDIDNDLYHHMFIAIAGRRWILSHGVRLAVMKCAQSDECRSALGKVIYLAVDQGIQEGLEAGFEHGRSGRSLAQVTIPIYSKSGSVSGEILLSEVVPTIRAAAERRGLCPPPLGGTSGFAPQPPIVQAHDDLFDTFVLDRAGGA